MIADQGPGSVRLPPEPPKMDPSDEQWERPERTKSDWFRSRAKGLWFKVQDFWYPLLVTSVFFGASWWAWSRIGLRPLGFAVAVILIGGFLIWRAVKIYYLKVMAFDWYPDTEELVIILFEIPIEQGPRINISGPSGFVKDQYGQEIRIVSEFDPISLEGVGSWPNGWTKAHFVGYLGFCWKLIGITKAIILKYGMGNEQAQADYLKYRAMLAQTRDFVLYPEDDEAKREVQVKNMERSVGRMNEEIEADFEHYRP